MIYATMTGQAIYTTVVARMIYAVITAPLQIFIDVTAPIAHINEFGQLYDDTTGSLLYDGVTGAPLTW